MEPLNVPGMIDVADVRTPLIYSHTRTYQMIRQYVPNSSSVCKYGYLLVSKYESYNKGNTVPIVGTSWHVQPDF